MKKFLTTILLLPLWNFSFAQDKQAEFDSLFSPLLREGRFNGNVLVAEKGNIIFEKSFGIADEKSQRPLNIATIFELASVSKQFTAMAILLLQEQGKLKMDDPLEKHIPELDFYKPVTVKDLVHHTAGLPDYMNLFEEKWDKTKFAVNQDVIDMLAKFQPAPVFQPGEKFEYSNTGYVLLGTIIERASGKPFEQFLEENIFRPLGMKNTFVYRSRYKPRKIENYALGYFVDESVGKKIFPDDLGKEYYTYYLDGIVGDGMVNSNLHDLLTWDRALYSEKFMKTPARESLFTASLTNDGTSTFYGFGWFVIKNPAYGRIANHSGGWAGYSTYIERHLDNDKTFIVLQNNSSSRTSVPVKEIRRILYGEPAEEKPVAKTYTAEELDVFVGTFSSENHPLKITISRDGNNLKAMAEGQSTIPLSSFENNIFTFDPAGIVLKFSADGNQMQLSQADRKFIFKKN